MSTKGSSEISTDNSFHCFSEQWWQETTTGRLAGRTWLGVMVCLPRTQTHAYTNMYIHASYALWVMRRWGSLAFSQGFRLSRRLALAVLSLDHCSVGCFCIYVSILVNTMCFCIFARFECMYVHAIYNNPMLLLKSLFILLWYPFVSRTFANVISYLHSHIKNWTWLFDKANVNIYICRH